MFLGKYNPRLLEKGRIALPKKIRNEVGGADVVLTIGFETCVFGFDKKTWDEVVRPELEKPFFSDPEARRMRRKMCVNAEITHIDSQGRIVVPDTMRDYAKVKEDIIVIGAGDHFEIWDTTNWIEYEKNL